MINLCMVMEVIQKSTPARTMVMMPGTQPNTLSDQVCAMMARQTWSPARSQEAFCQVIVRSLMSCLLVMSASSQNSFYWAVTHTGNLRRISHQLSCRNSTMKHVYLTFSNQRGDGSMAIVIDIANIVHHRLLLIVVVVCVRHYCVRSTR